MHSKSPSVMAFCLICLGILAKNMPKRLAGYYLLNSYNYFNTISANSQLIFYANKLRMIAQISPVNPMIVSIIVHDFSVVFSSISSNEPTSQNPESFT